MTVVFGEGMCRLGCFVSERGVCCNCFDVVSKLRLRIAVSLLDWERRYCNPTKDSTTQLLVDKWDGGSNAWFLS